MNPNIELIRRFIEEQVNQDDISRYDQFFSKDVISYGPASDQITEGCANLQKIQASYHLTYPGTKFKIEDIFAIGDRVFVRWICKGMYKGKSHSKKSSCILTGLSIYQILQGQIHQAWQFWDRLGILEQIGEIRIHKENSSPELLISLGMEKYAERAATLSVRERQCLQCLLEGKTAKETAAFYQLSSRTVETYFQKLKKKLKCYTKRDLFTAAQVLAKLELL
jgi:DNA-binding CsgD family transcriptional regulator/predicted ester cyclase